MSQQQITRAESSAQSVTSYAKLKEKLGDTLTPEALTVQLERLEAVWGRPRDRTDAQAVNMVREWFDALSGFGERVVKNATTHAMTHHSFGWTNALPFVFDFCRRETREWMDALRLPAPVARAPEVQEPIDVAARAAQCLKWRQEYASVFAPEPRATEPALPVAAALPNEHVSPQLEAWARKRGLWRGPANEDWRMSDDVA